MTRECEKYTYTHTCMYVYKYIQTHTYIHNHTHTYMHRYCSGSIRYRHLHTHIHTYIHTYIHTAVGQGDTDERQPAIFPDGAVLTSIPLISFKDVVLFPGQTLPLTLERGDWDGMCVFACLLCYVYIREEAETVCVCLLCVYIRERRLGR
jgi:hypothetical protein